jgi:hypothetical protein
VQPAFVNNDVLGRRQRALDTFRDFAEGKLWGSTQYA